MSGNFTISNGKIFDPSGVQFIARGINVGDNSIAAAIVAKFPGINFVRFAVDSYQPASYFQSFVSELTAKKIVVEIEHHPWPIPNAYIGAQLDEEANWYTSLVPSFKNNPYVWYGSMNEPHGPLNNISNQHLSTYAAIRNAGGNNIIMLAAGVGSGDPGLVGAGAGLLAPIYPSMTLILWDLHCYGWVTDFSTDQTAMNNKLLGSANTNTGIRATETIQSANGKIPVIVGEFGVSTTGQSPDANSAQTIGAVTEWALSNGYTSGYAGWHWNADAYNALQVNGNLTPWGTKLAAAIQATANSSPATPTTPTPTTPTTPTPTTPTTPTTPVVTPPGEGDGWIKLPATTGTTIQYSNLTPNQLYSFRVISSNVKGWAYSNLVLSTDTPGVTPTPTPTPTTPTPPTPTPTTPTPPTPTPAGMFANATFADDFTTLSLHNTRNAGAGGNWQPAYWYSVDGMAQHDGWITNPFNPATPINDIYTVSNSVLNMLIKPTPPAYRAACANLPYVCGNLTTATSFRQLHGYFEAKFRQPNVPGLGNAFWLMSDVSWPPELDIIETVNVGSWIGAYTVWNMNATIAATSWTYVSPGNSFDATQWHTYGVDWTASTITWYIDRQVVFTAPTPAGYNLPMFMIIGCGPGEAGGWGGTITNPSLLPAAFEVDYAAVWPSRSAAGF